MRALLAFARFITLQSPHSRVSRPYDSVCNWARLRLSKFTLLRPERSMSIYRKCISPVSGALFVSLVMLGGCGGGGSTSPSIPPQNPQQQNPAQTPPPASVGVTSSVKIYATSNGKIGVFDEEGHPIANCPFPNIHEPSKIAFDSHNGKLYITNFSSALATQTFITVYDLQGNQIKTTGSFSGAFPLIAFDSNNDRVYTVTEGSHPPQIAAFDEEGNTIPINGNFLDSGQPMDVAFDPFNHQFYVVDSLGPDVFVFDEQGNQVPFNAANVPTISTDAITFDTHNHLFYVGSAEPLNGVFVAAFDESGNIVPLTGSFANANAVLALTFDAHNNRLYEEDFSGNVHAYDEEGNPIPLSGTFPGVLGPGLVAASQ